MLLGLNFVLLHVPDVTAVTSFYTEKLGLVVDLQAPDFVQFKQPSGSGAILAIGNGEVSGDQGAELWFYVDDANATHNALKAQGVEVVDEPKDEPFGRTFAIKDPAGNKLYMLQPTQ